MANVASISWTKELAEAKLAKSKQLNRVINLIEMSFKKDEIEFDDSGAIVKVDEKHYLEIQKLEVERDNARKICNDNYDDTGRSMLNVLKITSRYEASLRGQSYYAAYLKNEKSMWEGIDVSAPALEQKSLV